MKKRLTILWLLCAWLSVSAQSTVRIWEGTGKGSSKVTLAEYLPDTPAETAVIVCPGGSYFWLDIETEGDSVARSLRAQGIAAYVLKYRTGGVVPFITHSRLVVSGHHHPMPLDDVQQAIRLVRQKQYRRLGVMGFSAGGHLALSAGIFGKGELRPDFIVPCYPVVTMSESCVHKRSRRGLLGEYKKASPRMCDSLSLEKHVTTDCPPVFLMNCVDDPVVDYRNSVLMDQALTAKHVPHQYVQYQTGGHGFGTTWSKTSAEASGWFDAFLKWLKTIE